MWLILQNSFFFRKKLDNYVIGIFKVCQIFFALYVRLIIKKQASVFKVTTCLKLGEQWHSPIELYSITIDFEFRANSKGYCLARSCHIVIYENVRFFFESYCTMYFTSATSAQVVYKNQRILEAIFFFS